MESYTMDSYTMDSYTMDSYTIDSYTMDSYTMDSYTMDSYTKNSINFGIKYYEAWKGMKTLNGTERYREISENKKNIKNEGTPKYNT